MDGDLLILRQLSAELPPALLALLIPAILLYLSLYAFACKRRDIFVILSVPTLLGFWMSSKVAPVTCAALRAQLNFIVAVSTMKLLDIHALSWTNSFPSYNAGTPPSPAILALILLTELRYESFTPNPIRLPFLPRYPFPTSLEKRQFFYLEFNQYLIHLALFILLQSLPQILPVKALGVLFTIWLIWTTIQLLVRYPTSPPLFGPLYLIESLATFWTGTWHNVFASSCYSLAYTPTIFVLTKLRAPTWISRPAAVVAAFAFMAAFHMYALEPLLTREGLRRIGWFFVGNGILTVAETGVWGRKRHWVRALMAWIAELSLASWTVAAADLPDGALKANWRGLCEWKRD